MSTRYTQHVITESEGYTQSVKADADLQASGWGAKMKASFSTSSTQSGSSSSVLLKTNAWVEYDRATKVQGDSGKCQPFLESVERELKDKAKIPGGLQEWHDKHGTHFISGYYAFASHCDSSHHRIRQQETGRDWCRSIRRIHRVRYDRWGLS